MSESLLPPNSTPEEQHIEASIARLGDIPISIEQLWNPDTCPTDLLPWLAWALDVDEWHSDWLEEHQRQTIKQSAIVHLKKGTIGAVKKALQAVGAEIQITEWFEPGSDLPPYTFRLLSWANANLTPNGKAVLGPELYSALQRLVDSVKPARSHYDIRIGAAFDNELGVNATTSAGQSLCQEIHPQQAPIQSTGELNTAALLQTGEVSRQPMTATITANLDSSTVTVAAISRSVSFAQFSMEAL